MRLKKFNKRFLKIILLLMLVGCSKNKYEKELIGVWNNFPSGGPEEIRFYKDSVISCEYSLRRKGTWKATSSQIELYFPSMKNVEGYRAKYTLDYKLNGDSLSVKNLEDSIYAIPVFFKVKNYWTHYLKKFDFQIDLPEANFEMTKNDAIEYGIDFFIGYKNKRVIIKPNRFLQYGNDISSYIKSFVYSERASWKEKEVKNLYFNLIVDKNVSEQKIDSIKNILNIFPEMKIFRVYKNDKANYGKYDLENENWYDWNWYGRFE